MSENETGKAMRVFLSYAPRDREFAARLSAMLRSEGAEIVDPDLRQPDSSADAALAALKRSDFLVFVVPRFEGEGADALAELGAARVEGKTIVPVIPGPGWYANSAIASAVSRYPALDASRLPKEELAKAILARGLPQARVA